MTIHDEIDNYLAADLHNELSDEERNALHTHLVECADCRKIHQETKTMNTALEEKLADEKPNPAFEQRMLAHFRNRAANRSRPMKFIADILHLRVVRVAVATVFLIMVGSWLTSVRFGFLGRPSDQEMNEMLQGNSLSDLRARLSWPEQKAEMDKEAKNLATVPAGTFAEADKASTVTAGAPPPPTAAAGYGYDGARARTDMLTKMPASTGGLARQAGLTPEFHEAKAAPSSESDTEKEVAAAPPEPAANPTDTYRRENSESTAVTTPNPALANRKLIRNATVDLEIVKFDEAVQKITAFAAEEKGYVATTKSEKQENGKLSGEVVVKVLPENLDRFLQKIRGLGELKNQTLGTEDITKNYFDTEARLKNARVMESRLVDMLKKKSDDINDLLQVEKELGRVREQIEQMQGELKFWDSQVQFATVTI